MRRATPTDVPALVALGAEFIEAAYAAVLRVDVPTLTALIHGLIGGAGVVFVAEQAGVVVGLIGLTVYAHPISGDRVASELAWWVTPTARGGRGALRLLAVGEAWARDQQAVALHMIAPSDKVARFYERLGFAKVETQYQRAL